MKKQTVKSWREVPLVEVIWQDAVIATDHEGQLSDHESAKKFGGLAACRDIGYLISKTRSEIRLAVSLCSDDDTYRHSNTIPRSWVKAIIVLQRSGDQLHRPNEGPPDPLPTDRPPSVGNRSPGPGDRSG